jgi:erythromycin esterase-like protein
MNDTSYLAARIEQLESWVAEAITRPSMSRERRLQGLDILEAQSLNPSVRQAVERICPRQAQSMERSLEIER